MKDATGQAKAAPVVLTAMDAKVEASPEEGKSSPVTARVETSGTSSQLVFTPDAAFLADPAVTYPVTIAAASEWFGGGIPNDAWVNKNSPSSNNAAAGWLRAGTTQTSADIARVYLKFNTAAPELVGATVVDADLYVWNYKSGGPNGQLCGNEIGSGIGASLITSAWTPTGLSWSNQPSSAGIMTGSGNKAGYNIDASGTWCASEAALVHRITGMARAWIEQGTANHGLVLRAVTESPAINWRQYYASEHNGSPYPGYRHPPTLMIEYTPAPTRTEWVQFESDDDLTEFPTYQQAKALEAEPLDDTANWALSNQEADEIEKLGVGTPYEVDTNRLQPLPSDVEIDPSTLDPEEVPAGSLPGDETKPTVTAVQPAADSPNVPVGTKLTATFSEPVWEPKITVKDSAQSTVQGTAELDTTRKILTFTPAQPLKPATAYSAEASEARDADDNEMDPHSWSFTTENDTTPPTVSAVTPEAQSTTVPVTTPITVTFSEAVTDAQLALKDPAGTAVAGTPTMDTTQRVLTFTPTQPLAENTVYSAEVSGAKDIAGNAMAQPHTWSFTTGTKAPAGLVAAYGMNEGAGTNVSDSSGHGNAGVATATSWRNGKYGKALSFNGSSSWVTVQDAASLRLTTGMTLSAWVNPATVATWSSIVGKELQAEGVSYLLYAANSSSVPSGWVQTSTEDHTPVGATSPLSVNTWSHLALTYDGATLRLFVNGQQVAQSTMSGSLHDDGSPLRIGGNNIWGEFFSGLIDEVRIYNRAQTSAEIQTDMSTPIGSDTPGPTPTPTSTPTSTPNPVSGLVAAYGLNEGVGALVGDASGRNNTGAATDTSWGTGKYGSALSFNGTSSWVTVPHTSSLRLTDALTLSAWVRPAALDSIWRSVVMKELTTEEGGGYGLYASTQYDAPGGWLQTADGGGGIIGSNALPLNQWSHLAFTYDGSTAKMYVNGTLVSQPDVTGEILDDGGALRIGGNNVWDEFFSGLIDEVRIYNIAQTATQIQADMNNPIGSAPASAPAALRSGSTATASGIAKLAISGSKSTTPQFTVWTTDLRGRPAAVEVEVADRSAKSPKPKAPNATWTATSAPVWSGKVTAKADVSRHTVRIPADKLHKGEQLRWRARATVDGLPGAWSEWQTFTVGDARADGGSPTRTDAQASSASPTPAKAAASDPNTSGPFDYERLDLAQCNNERLKKSPRPNHGFGWTVVKPYTGCYSRVLGWGDFEVNIYTGLPTSRCPKSTGVMMTATVVAHTYLGTKNNFPVVHATDTTRTASELPPFFRRLWIMVHGSWERSRSWGSGSTRWNCASAR